jgi:hypothetical protein
MHDEPQQLQAHNMNELVAMVNAIPEEHREEVRMYVEGFMDGQMKLLSHNRLAFGLYTMWDAEDRATMNTIEATCARYNIQRKPPEA